MHDQSSGQSGQPPLQEMQQNVTLVIGLIQTWGRLVEVFLRRPGTWGERFSNVQMVVSWIIGFVFGPFFYRQHDPRPMLFFWLAGTAMLLVHRIVGVWRRWRGDVPHSLYSGKPWIPGNEATAKTFWEPLLVCCVGIGCIRFSEPLGMYLFLAGICVAIGASWQAAAERARIRQMRDAKLDQERLMRQLQEDE